MTPRFCDAFNARKVVQTKKVRQRNRVVALGLKLPIQKRRYIRFDRDVQGCKRAVNPLVARRVAGVHSPVTCDFK